MPPQFIDLVIFLKIKRSLTPICTKTKHWGVTWDTPMIFQPLSKNYPTPNPRGINHISPLSEPVRKGGVGLWTGVGGGSNTLKGNTHDTRAHMLPHRIGIEQKTTSLQAYETLCLDNQVQSFPSRTTYRLGREGQIGHALVFGARDFALIDRGSLG